MIEIDERIWDDDMKWREHWWQLWREKRPKIDAIAYIDQELGRPTKGNPHGHVDNRVGPS